MYEWNILKRQQNHDTQNLITNPSSHDDGQSMSERHSFERHSERRSEQRSFFRERKVSAILFRHKERRVSAALKNWWVRAQNALFFALFFGDNSVSFWPIKVAKYALII